MRQVLKTLVMSLVIIASLTACKKAQEESAQTGKEAATELKSNIDAAKGAAADMERAAKETADAAEKISVDVEAAGEAGSNK